MLVQSAEAQLLRRVFGRSSTQVSSSCPGGVCPVAAAQSAQVQVPLFAPIKAVANAGRGHWSYPGTIDSHLEGTHGVATQGMTREQKLDMHDALHEGGSVVRSVPVHSPGPVIYHYSSPVVNYGGGSTGSFSGGSTGSRVVQSYGSTGSSVVASDTVTVLRLGDRAKFKRSLMAAAKQAVADEKITQDQYDALNFAIKFPGVAQKIEAALHETAIENGLASPQAIDWDQLADFIERMIPIILKLIDLFS